MVSLKLLEPYQEPLYVKERNKSCGLCAVKEQAGVGDLGLVNLSLVLGVGCFNYQATLNQEKRWCVNVLV